MITLQEKPFHIYRSSAGSGKTRTLAREYITLALRNPQFFRYILAVTFTNKSTQEMKDRIINYLWAFSEGKGGELADEIRVELGITESELASRSKEVLTGILHQYSQFSISTIDAFFQRVIRSFTRESGLLGNFRLEAEIELVMQEVVSQLMDELGEPGHEQLTQWVVQFSSHLLSEGKNWNFSRSLLDFSNEIFSEQFKAIEPAIRDAQQNVDLAKLMSTIRAERFNFIRSMKSKALLAMEIIQRHGLSADDFNRKANQPAYKYFSSFASGKYMGSDKLENSAADESAWTTKTNPKRLVIGKMVKQELLPLLNDMIGMETADGARYKSLGHVEKNFYEYGLITDLTRKLRDYKTENNIMLLSDASQFLNGIISESDTPFIYEKVGSFYKHYLIDEFQDTSSLQWQNFQPLLRDALDQNNRVYLVGDVKQSIYRWRGGDLGLLQQQVIDDMGPDRTEKHLLDHNYRSASNIVGFNNALFTTAADMISKQTEQTLPGEVFSDVQQVPSDQPSPGFVRIQFLESGEDGFTQQAIERIPKWFEELQTAHVPLRDVVILVRRNEEGQKIATYLLQYKNSPKALPGFSYDVVSNESLKLDASSTVLLLIAAIKYLVNPDDPVALAELIHGYRQLSGSKSAEEQEEAFQSAGRRKGRGILPEELVNQSQTLTGLAMFDLVESLVRLFGLDKENPELVYLQSFQDIIIEFSMQEKNDPASFLEWWETIRDKKSVQVSANINAVSIYTLHKSKGLQFRYVLIPFCQWGMNHGTHAPLLWCRAAEQPIADLKYVAVRYNKDLAGSWFESNYDMEYTKTYLDNLNLLYVAMTRAEVGLMVMAPTQGKEVKINQVGQLLYHSIQNNLILLQHYDAAASTLNLGDLAFVPRREEPRNYEPISLDRYRSADWHKKLVIRRQGREFFQPVKSGKRQRINHGVLMHEVLSRVNHTSDVEGALAALGMEGIVMAEEHEEIARTIFEMMKHPVIGKWFDDDWVVRTESPVIIPGGSPGRMDRVMWKEVDRKGKKCRKAVIVDYKTGEKKAEDRRQVEAYAAIVSQMGYVDVEAYLLYLENCEVVQVVNKANLSLEL